MANKLLFKEQNESLFWQYWQKVLEVTGAGPRYSPISLKSWILIAKSQGVFHADKSFIYLQNSQPVAAVYFPLLKIDTEIVASIPGDYLYAPLMVNNSVEKELFFEIDKLARENSVAKIEFQIDPLDQQTTYNYLQKYGYLESSILAYVIDLTLSDFLSSCRTDHRSRIKKILTDNEVVIFYTDQSDSSYQIHEQYRELHHKMAGHVTRPKETFDMQFERLKLGEAVLFGLKYRGQTAAFTYFDFRADKANYASAVHELDLPRLPFGHALVYKAAEYLKALGVKFIDTEQPGSPSMQLGYYPDPKQLNIALFKRGFGGRFVQNFRGVKYFSKDVFSRDLNELTSKYQLTSYEK